MLVIARRVDDPAEVHRRRPWTELLGACRRTKHRQLRDNCENCRQQDLHPNLKSVRHVFLLVFLFATGAATLWQAEKRSNPRGIFNFTSESPYLSLREHTHLGRWGVKHFSLFGHYLGC